MFLPAPDNRILDPKLKTPYPRLYNKEGKLIPPTILKDGTFKDL